VSSELPRAEHAVIIEVGELLLLAGFLCAVVVTALRRANWDWPYRLRMTRSFALIDMMDSPWDLLELDEVLLAAPGSSPRSTTIAFAHAVRPQEVMCFELDRPLGERAERCAGWWAAQTPLLFAGDLRGDAALHGPDCCLVGHVVSWTERARHDAAWSR
jgi:hypothetical protein